MSFITILDVCRSLGIEPTKKLTRSVRRSATARFRTTYGAYPEKKALKTARNGNRRYCFTIYPEDFRADIEDEILARPNEPVRQLDLFP